MTLSNGDWVVSETVTSRAKRLYDGNSNPISGTWAEKLLDRLTDVASHLWDDDPDSFSEYARGQVELIGDACSLMSESRDDVVAEIIRAKRKPVTPLWNVDGHAIGALSAIGALNTAKSLYSYEPTSVRPWEPEE